MSTTSYEDRYEKCKCGQPGTTPHPCPYAADVNDDSETLCNCCEDCMRECADDV